MTDNRDFRVYQGGQSFRPKASQRVEGGGGPPHDGDMERRVEDLERRIDRVEAKLDTIIDSLSEVRAEIRHLPGKTFVITVVVSIVGLVIAAIALAPYLRVPAGQ